MSDSLPPDPVPPSATPSASLPGGALEGPSEGTAAVPAKGPLSLLTGALTSALLAWLSWKLSRRVVTYYLEHPPHFEAQVAQSIATAFKTLVVGMSFLATFSFAFIGFGLLLSALRRLVPGGREPAS